MRVHVTGLVHAAAQTAFADVSRAGCSLFVYVCVYMYVHVM